MSIDEPRKLTSAKNVDLNRGGIPYKAIMTNRKKKCNYTAAKLCPLEDTDKSNYGWNMLPLLEVEGNLPPNTEEIRKELFLKLRNVWTAGATRSSTRAFYPFKSTEEEAMELPAWPAENRPRNRWPEYEVRQTGNQGKKPHFLTH